MIFRDRIWNTFASLFILGTILGALFVFVLSYEAASAGFLNPLSSTLIAVVALQPLLGYIAFQLVEQRRLKRELTRIASYDRITGCYNSMAFSSLIERRTVQPLGERHGAFLIVRLEHLRSVKLRYGLEWANESERLVASIIKKSVRSDDVVGNLGSGEFGIFLPFASEKDAVEIGKRIRSAVAALVFAPKADDAALEVRVAGIVFLREIELEEMFRSAGEQIENDAACREVPIARLQ